MTVFVLALLFITAVELISGKPLSAIFGGADTGTTLKNLVNPSAGARHHPDVDHVDHDDHARRARPTTTTHGGTATSTTEPTGSGTTTTTSRVAVDDHHDSGGRGGRDDDDDLGAVVAVEACVGYQPLNSAGRLSTKLAMPSLESRVLVTSSCPSASS